MSAPRILLVDDEVAIQRAVAPLLRSRGYEVEVAGTGTDALRIVASHPPDLIVLDLGLPDLEGTEVCRRVRAESTMPIVVLSARGAEADKVQALDLGADDYVTKPFGPEELLARIRVALRRVLSEERSESGRLQAGDITIDYDRRRAFRGDCRDSSHAKGVRVAVAARQKSRSRADAPRDSQGHLGRQRGRAAGTPLDAHRQLRRKIERDPATPRYLLSEPWVGYRFSTADPADDR